MWLLMKNNNQLFYTCSLIEYIGRLQKRKRSEIVTQIGKNVLERIYNHADVLHSEPIEKVEDEFIVMCQIDKGNYDNISQSKYNIPDYWAIGEVYERLIEDIDKRGTVEMLMIVYNLWISDAISNYNSDFYYQSRGYIYQCYLAGEVL